MARGTVSATAEQENTMSRLLARFSRDQSGATAIEYGLITALISIAIIAAVQSIGVSIEAKFEKANDCVKASTSAAQATC